MIESVVALLMFINGEIKEHLIQDNMQPHAFEANVKQRETFSESVSYKCYIEVKKLRDRDLQG